MITKNKLTYDSLKDKLTPEPEKKKEITDKVSIRKQMKQNDNEE
jgi:hypothetical protein